MICPNCGQQLSEGTRFCIGCGTKIDPDSRKGKKPGGKTVLLVIALILAVLLILLGVFLLVRPEQETLRPETEEVISGSLPPEETAPSGEEPGETEAPGETEPTEETREPEPEGIPQERPMPSGENKGIPAVNVSPEKLQLAWDQYSAILGARTEDTCYGLLNMLGDELPELILRQKAGEREYYSFWYLMEVIPVPIQSGEIMGNSTDMLFGENGKLWICYTDTLAVPVSLDWTFTAQSEMVNLDEGWTYTDTVLTADAADLSLLEFVLTGRSDTFRYSGWIRWQGRDYLYREGLPVNREWHDLGEICVYVGADGYISQYVDEALLQETMDAYCRSFMEAVNAENAAALNPVTESCRESVAKRMQEEQLKERTYTGFSCQPQILRYEDATGSLSLYVKTQWNYGGKWTKDLVLGEAAFITLVWQEGQWLVDTIRLQASATK